MKYKVHRFDLKMTADQHELEQFLNSLKGEVVTIIPNVTVTPLTWASRVDFLLIVERQVMDSVIKPDFDPSRLIHLFHVARQLLHMPQVRAHSLIVPLRVLIAEMLRHAQGNDTEQLAHRKQRLPALLITAVGIGLEQKLP